MYLRIYWELVADPLGPAEHSLATAGLGDRTDSVGTQSLVVPVAKTAVPEGVHAVDMNNTATNSACVTQFLLRMNISLAANNKIYVCELYQLIMQASATYGTRAKRDTWNDFQWHAE